MTHIQNVWANNTLTNKQNRSQCCGCSACESICKKKAISMKADKEGFLYPVVDVGKCVDCGLCTKVCPVVNECNNNNHYLKIYAGYTKDDVLLNQCATGGIGTALALYIVKKGGVVFGVQYSPDYKNVEYGIATTEEEVRRFCGSKYVQASKTGIFEKVKKCLNTGRFVLFTGCPCDVSGLKNYLRIDYKNLITCELICAGITSHKVLNDYRVWSESKNGKHIEKINMRHKLRGWFVTSLEETFNDNSKKYKNFYATYLGHAFLTFPRPSCLKCQYRGTVSQADIKIGDFWGIKDSDEFWNPNGVSVIFVNTQKGLDILKMLDDFALFETTYEYATKGNHSAVENHGEYYVRLRDKFEQLYIIEGKGLIPSCKATASNGFWVKHFVPDNFHTIMKKLYHAIIDKKR